jgi:peptide/nickel transport system permease protein
MSAASENGAEEVRPAVAESDNYLRMLWSDFAESPRAVAALAVCVLLLLCAILAPLIAPQNPYDLKAIDMFDSRMPPGSKAASGMYYWLGTDGQGRDMLSAMLYGLRTSLFVGVLSGVLAIALGVALGLTAAYWGGLVDSIILRLVDFMLGFPTILVALMLLAVLGQGTDKVIIALIVVQWAYFAAPCAARPLSSARRNMSKRQSRSTPAMPASSSAICCRTVCRRSSSSARSRSRMRSRPRRRCRSSASVCRSPSPRSAC